MKELASPSVTTLLLIVFASVLCLIFLVFLGFLARRSWRRLDELELKDRFAARNDFIKTTAQILGGAFFLFGLYFTWQNLIETQIKNRADLSIAQDKQTTELYTKAIEQLGSDKLEVRLGAIYALERIARDSKKDRCTIMEVLTAFVRNNAPVTAASKATPLKETLPDSRKVVPTKTGERTREEQPKPKADIQAVLTVIGRRPRTFGKGEIQPLDLRQTDLRGADLRNANLEGAILVGSHLEKADLSGASLWVEGRMSGADLRQAHLEEAILVGSTLTRADLRQAHLEGAHLKFAHLEWASLWQAHLEQATLHGAGLKGAILVDAHLTTADLREADLEGAWLHKARLEGAILDGANFRFTQGLRIDDLRSARNWVLAHLSEEIFLSLGLPEDHNQRLENRDLSFYNFAGMDLREANFELIKNLQGANFSAANLEKAHFDEVDMEKAILEKANLKGALLRNAKGLTREQLAGAIMDKNTKLPDYLHPKPASSESK